MVGMVVTSQRRPRADSHQRGLHRGFTGPWQATGQALQTTDLLRRLVVAAGREQRTGREQSRAHALIGRSTALIDQAGAFTGAARGAQQVTILLCAAAWLLQQRAGFPYRGSECEVVTGAT